MAYDSDFVKTTKKHSVDVLHSSISIFRSGVGCPQGSLAFLSPKEIAHLTGFNNVKP